MHGEYPCTGGDMNGRWGYILWDRSGPSMHDGYPCTGGDMYNRWGYILWDRLGPNMHFVQFSLIVTTANTYSPAVVGSDTQKCIV